LVGQTKRLESGCTLIRAEDGSTFGDETMTDSIQVTGTIKSFHGDGAHDGEEITLCFPRTTAPSTITGEQQQEFGEQWNGNYT
jgi:hypothetical protein